MKYNFLRMLISEDMKREMKQLIKLSNRNLI